eukprot:s153_g29.t1
MDEREEVIDRFAAGAMLFCLYSRSRLSDLKKLRGYCKDVSEHNGAISGYLEFRTRSHKTARLVARQGIAMPLVAPVWGLLSPPWGLNFVRVSELAGRQLECLDDEALLPAPINQNGIGWQDRAVTTTEAGKWLRSLLSRRSGMVGEACRPDPKDDFKLQAESIEEASSSSSSSEAETSSDESLSELALPNDPDLGAAAAALKKRRLEMEASAKE